LRNFFNLLGHSASSTAATAALEVNPFNVFNQLTAFLHFELNNLRNVVQFSPWKLLIIVPHIQFSLSHKRQNWQRDGDLQFSIYGDTDTIRVFSFSRSLLPGEPRVAISNAVQLHDERKSLFHLIKLLAAV
jgi:hypothetical protein